MNAPSGITAAKQALVIDPSGNLVMSKDEVSAAKVQDNGFWTLFFNAFRLRCAVCKQGKIFKGWFGIRERCPVCNVEVEREAGFFLGSIYFNYGLTCTIALVVFLVGYFALNIPPIFLYPPLFLFVISFPLWFLRYARASLTVFDQYFQPRVPDGFESQPKG